MTFAASLRSGPPYDGTMRGLIACAFLIACSSAPPPQAWPAGDYCVLRDGPTCPRATNGRFEQGSIVIDTDNGVTFARSHGASREIDSGDDDDDGLLSIEVCCGSFTDTGEAFPAESFVVLAGGSVTEGVSCPVGFTPGSVFIDAEDYETFGDNADSFVTGSVGASTIAANRNVDIIVCESSAVLAGAEMPRAPYCVFGGFGGCPDGFSSGSITTYDESSGNIDELTGAVGGISQSGASTRFPICCY
jgi:hypothetical protein